MSDGNYNQGEQWACPNCSDPVDPDIVVVLQQDDDEHWTCPGCGCSTSFPQEEGCWLVDPQD